MKNMITFASSWVVLVVATVASAADNQNTGSINGAITVSGVKSPENVLV